MLVPATAGAQAFDRLRDRGPGVPVSMFGSYIESGQLFIYPFFEYYRDSNAEYKPAELGYGLEQDFRAKYRAYEGLIFIGYGISERLAVEFEAAVIRATQHKAPEDPSTMPATLTESGLGDVEGQLRWLWNREDAGTPAFFTYFETVFPLQKSKQLIGTAEWEFKLGSGMVRGFRWGTTTLRLGIGYSEGSLELGEYAVEYLRRLSSQVRLFGAIEGSEDEVELITEAQWFLKPGIVLKLNNAFGITSKAAGWAPEVGILFIL
jgi:hypothetical protein